MTRGRRRLRPLTLVLGGAVLIGVVWILRVAGHALIVTVPVTAPDAIISLGSHEWERLPIASRLALLEPHTLLLLTVPPSINEKNCYQCRDRVEQLRRAGVPPDRIRELPLVHGSTYGEAEAVATFAASNTVRRLLIVTSPYHTRRALATFRHVLQGRNVEVGIVPATLLAPARPDRWWVAGYDRWYVTHEWAGLVYYAFKHGLTRW